LNAQNMPNPLPEQRPPQQQNDDAVDASLSVDEEAVADSLILSVVEEESARTCDSAPDAANQAVGGGALSPTPALTPTTIVAPAAISAAVTSGHDTSVVAAAEAAVSEGAEGTKTNRPTTAFYAGWQIEAISQLSPLHAQCMSGGPITNTPAEQIGKGDVWNGYRVQKGGNIARRVDLGSGAKAYHFFDAIFGLHGTLNAVGMWTGGLANFTPPGNAVPTSAVVIGLAVEVSCGIVVCV
jgi:hypothetical protein